MEDLASCSTSMAINQIPVHDVPKSRVRRISKPHFQSGLKMSLVRAGGGGEGKARMGYWKGLGEMMFPIWTFSAASRFDGGKLQPRFGHRDHVSWSIPHNPNFHNIVVWGRVGRFAMQGRERVIASSRHSIRVSPPDVVALLL